MGFRVMGFRLMGFRDMGFRDSILSSRVMHVEA